MDVITGYVEHIIYRNEENSYTVMNVSTRDDEVTCVGVLPFISEGEYIEASGTYTVHASYGEQFKIDSFQVRPPEDEMAIERYLGSGAIKGIGSALAARIVRRFKEDTFRIIEEEPERLAEVKGISERKAREIAAQVEEKKDVREAFIFLSGYGISNALALKIYNQYGSGLYRVIRENPYRMADDVTGVGFKIADEIARRAGIEADSDFRIRCGLLYTLTRASADGHIYLPKEELLEKTAQLLGLQIEEPEHYLADLSMDRRIVMKKVPGTSHIDMYRSEDPFSFSMHEDGAASMHEDLAVSTHENTAASMQEVPGASMHEDPAASTHENTAASIHEAAAVDVPPDIPREECRVYAAPLYFLELNTAKMLCDLNVNERIDEEQVLRKISRIEQKNEQSLDEHQREAVLEAVRRGLLILTGGPGTGKTTTINTMIALFQSEGLDIALAAPTGRAAKRMTEATGYEAKTIHRLLEVEGGPAGDEKSRDGGIGESGTGMFGRNASNPLEADVIIVDEMSMVDIYLMHALLSAVTPGTRLILVGDASQLPSVGPGCVLRDIIESDTCKVVRLTRIFRQAEQSDIIVNAHKINRGEHMVLDNKSRDFFFLRRSDANVIISIAIQLISEKLPGYVNASPMEIQVLTPTRKGLLGVERLNRILQQYLNPASHQKEEHMHGDILFREGDKVMQIKNNYQLEWEIRGRYGYVAQSGTGVFNGDIGVIETISQATERMTVIFDDERRVEYPFSGLDELELAYAVTIHKSQGSEYPAVVIPLLPGPRMLMNRNLLYTAVTRARSCVTIVGEEQVFFDMIDNTQQQKRYTSLKERLIEIAGV